MPDEALKKASERLLRYLQEPSLIDVPYSTDRDHSRFAVQAYAGYVLARSEQAPLGSLRSLFERREQSLSGLPLVHLAVALQRMGDAPRADQALQAGLAKGRKENRWLDDYGSPLRDQALMLALLLQLLLMAVVVALIGLNPLGLLPQLLVWSLLGISSLLLKVLFFALIASVILSWIAPGNHNPGALLINQIVEPLLTPLRKVLPSLGGLDISPIFAFIAINLIDRFVLRNLAVMTDMPRILAPFM